MKTNINTKNIELTDEIKNYIEKKLESIQKILAEKANDVIAEIKLWKDTDSQKGDIYFVNIKINKFEATSNAESVNASLDKVKDELMKEIRRSKGKKLSLLKKGGRKIKSLLTGKWRK